LLKQYIKGINALVDEATIKATPDGFHAIQMDTSQVALVMADLKASEMERFDLQELEELEATINIQELKNVLDKVDSDTVDLEFGNNLRITGGDLNFNGSLLADAYTPPKEPQIDFEGWVKLKPSTLKRICESPVLVGGKALSFNQPKGKNMPFTCVSSGDTSDVRVRVDKVKGNMKKDVNNANYGVEYVDKLRKGLTGFKEVKINYGNEKPLKAEAHTDGINLTYYLAPRIGEV
jgi:hypothetical protein